MVALTVVAALAAACGSSSSPDASGGGTGGTTRPSPAGPVAGCERGWTDPADLSPTRQVARCQPGAPAPQPLPERQEVVVVASTKAAEFIAPLLLAIDSGEFAKEGLDVRIEVLPPPDALPLLARGEIQAWFSSPDAAFHNAVEQGFDLRWVAGNYFETPASRSGLWVGTDGGEATAEGLQGKPVATVSGIGSVITYPIDAALAEYGLSITDVEFKTFSAPDVISALFNGAVAGAWLLTPAWQQVDGKEGFAFVGGQPPGEPLGGIAFGPDLLERRPEVGEAFLRAYLRTINTHFDGAYKSDPAFVQRLSDLTGVPVTSLQATGELVMDWEIREGTSARMQDVWRRTGAITYDGDLPEDRIADRSVYEAVVGRTG